MKMTLVRPAALVAVGLAVFKHQLERADLVVGQRASAGLPIDALGECGAGDQRQKERKREEGTEHERLHQSRPFLGEGL